MNTKNGIIQDGRFAGLREISEKTLEKQRKRAKASINIPTKDEVVLGFYPARTGQNCQGGIDKNFDAIDQCQNFQVCGLCVDPSRAETSITRKPYLAVVKRLDEEAYRVK